MAKEAEKQGTKKLRIIPGTIELPHRITFRGKDLIFNPDCVVPCSSNDGFYADKLLQSKNNILMVATGKPPLEKYTWSQKAQAEELTKKFSDLTPEQKAMVYDLMKSFSEPTPNVEETQV